MSGPSEFARETRAVDLTPLFERLLAGGTLSATETTASFETIMRGEAHDAEIGALLSLLAMRVPTADELLGAARVMRAHVDRVPTKRDPDTIIDTAGTGGAPKTFNVSTVAAVIAAAAGDGDFAVAKHGNRSRTGRGSAEVLAALGVQVDADRQVQARCLDECGICFCFAIHHHPATRHVIGARKALGFATIFNLLGPLTNPAGAKRQVMGVYAERFVRPIAEALCDLGASRAMVVHSRDGLDEISIAAPTRVAHVARGEVTEEELDPRSLGFERASLSDLQARDLDDAARIFRAILSGEEAGPKADMAILNAAATIRVANGDGRAWSWEDAVERAREVIRSGRAMMTLQSLASVSQHPLPRSD